MKKLLNLLVAGVFILACNSSKNSQQSDHQSALPDNSRNSLDWAGTYMGSMPCNDCEAILVAITLLPDNSYIKRIRYKGKSDSIITEKGSFTWDTDGNHIYLNTSNNSKTKSKYKVGENKLFFMEKGGNQAAHEIAPQNTLTKQQATINDRYWKLVELHGQAVTADAQKMRREAYIVFQADGKLHGNTSCNQMVGRYELSDDGKIKFLPMAVTKMLCMENNLEYPFLQSIDKTTAYKIKEDTLWLYDEAGKILTKFETVYLR